jgi:hypothetical protein
MWRMKSGSSTYKKWTIYRHDHNMDDMDTTYGGGKYLWLTMSFIALEVLVKSERLYSTYFRTACVYVVIKVLIAQSFWIPTRADFETTDGQEDITVSKRGELMKVDVLVYVQGVAYVCSDDTFPKNGIRIRPPYNS